MRRTYIVLLSAVFASACSVSFERWADSDFESVRLSDTEYTVRKNDTLYAIAWLHNLDYLAIAKWNDIAEPYVIYPGQSLRLTPPPQARRAPQAKTVAATRPTKRDTLPRPQLRWSWPLAQLSGFAAHLRGIGIDGRPNQAVLAAEDGTVVYSGFGLKRYGGLVIVRHSGDFFSAYGFVNRITVTVSDKVKRKQPIAYLSPQNEARLYFDIRHRGRRLDPLKYLPARN